MRWPAVKRPMRRAALLAAALPLWIGCAGPAELSIFERGKQQFDQRQWADALATFDDVILQQPDNSAAHAYRGRALANLDQLNQALRSYDVAVRLAPDDPEAYYLRSNAHRKLGNKALADADYSKAKDLDPLSKLLYERTITAPEIATPEIAHAAATAKASPGGAKQQDPGAMQGSFAELESLGALLNEGDESDAAQRQTAPSSTLPAIGGNSLSGVRVHAAGPKTRPTIALPRPAAVADRIDEAADRADHAPEPPRVFETSKKPGESSENGDAVGRGSRSPSITTGVIRLAPSKIPPQRDIRSPRASSPYAAAPALPENNPLLNHAQLRGTARPNPLVPHSHDRFGLSAPPSKQPVPLANPFDPTHPSVVKKRPSGLPLSGTIGPAAVGSDPLRSNPFIPIQPDAFNPLTNTPIGGNPYGAPQPGALPFGLGNQGGPAPLAPPIPFGKLPDRIQTNNPSLNPFGIGSPRRADGLSGLYRQGPPLPGTLKPPGDLGWLLRPTLDRTLKNPSPRR